MFSLISQRERSADKLETDAMTKLYDGYKTARFKYSALEHVSFHGQCFKQSVNPLSMDANPPLGQLKRNREYLTINIPVGV